MCLQYKSFENTTRKGEIARNQQFVLFSQCFLYFQRTFLHFHQNQNYRLQTLSVWKSLKFVVLERVKVLVFHASINKFLFRVGSNPLWSSLYFTCAFVEIFLFVRLLYSMHKMHHCTIFGTVSDTVRYKLTHYQKTNFWRFQTERVCRRQFQIWRKWKKVIQTGRKHYGKRRNFSLRAISPFPTVFSKGLFHRGVKKRRHCVGIG